MKEFHRKILIIRLSSLGDVLLTYPLIKLIKDRFPETQIDFLVKEHFADAIRTNPFLNETILFKKENTRLIRNLIKEKGYDNIIDLQNNLRSKLLYLAALTKIFKFKKPTFKKLLFVYTKINLLKNNQSIAKHYIDTFFRNETINTIPIYFHIPEEVENRAKSIIQNQFENEKIIGIAPGAKHYTKRYPVELYKEVVNILVKKNFNVAIFGGFEDELICKELTIDKSKTKNFQNNNDLLLTAGLMKNCKVLISNDSGLMHLASLLKIPTVAIFGSTVKEFGFFPIFEKSIIVENPDLNCRPCSHIGKSECPKKHFKCMNDISPNLIVRKVEELLNG